MLRGECLESPRPPAFRRTTPSSSQAPVWHGRALASARTGRATLAPSPVGGASSILSGAT
eukprot:8619266-Pyramimonas_sp.AAC.1